LRFRDLALSEQMRTALAPVSISALTRIRPCKMTGNLKRPVGPGPTVTT
jgi:hypothetical protein